MSSKSDAGGYPLARGNPRPNSTKKKRTKKNKKKRKAKNGQKCVEIKQKKGNGGQDKENDKRGSQKNVVTFVRQRRKVRGID